LVGRLLLARSQIFARLIDFPSHDLVDQKWIDTIFTCQLLLSPISILVLSPDLPDLCPIKIHSSVGPAFFLQDFLGAIQHSIITPVKTLAKRMLPVR
jgi:hypothetical protein